MHRKFIGLVVATAVAITGFSASRARAADAHDILGGLAAIAIIGAAVNYYNKEQRQERVTRQYNYAPPPQQVRRPDHIRPLPRRVARYDLPQRCLKTYKGYSKKRPLLGPRCLEKNYKHANSLPQKCKVGFWNGKKVKRAYEPACLRRKGYRVVYR